MIEELLKHIPDKTENNTTTSHKFKRELYEFFKEFSNETVVELGTHRGQTTRILSHIFKKVYTINQSSDGYAEELNKDRTNIEYIVADLYKDNWWEKIPTADVFFIDAQHTYDAVLYDIEKCLSIQSPAKKYIIFDDYGLLEPVRSAINTALLSGQLIKVKEIGHPAGTRITPEHYFSASEGLICMEA